MRDNLGYDLEWKDENILTTSKMYNYWISDFSIEKITDKMPVASRKGSYKMVKPTAAYYARCVITVTKDSIKKD